MGTCWRLSAKAVQYFVKGSCARSLHNTTDCTLQLLLISLAQTYTQGQRDATECEAARAAHSLTMGPLRFLVVEEKGEYSISVSIITRSSTKVRDCRMLNSKKGKYMGMGRPGLTSFTCLRVSQAKLAEMAAADNAEEDEADTLKQGNDDCDTPRDPPTNPELNVEES